MEVGDMVRIKWVPGMWTRGMTITPDNVRNTSAISPGAAEFNWTGTGTNLSPTFFRELIGKLSSQNTPMLVLELVDVNMVSLLAPTGEIVWQRCGNLTKRGPFVPYGKQK